MFTISFYCRSGVALSSGHIHGWCPIQRYKKPPSLPRIGHFPRWILGGYPPLSKPISFTQQSRMKSVHLWASMLFPKIIVVHPCYCWLKFDVTCSKTPSLPLNPTGFPLRPPAKRGQRATSHGFHFASNRRGMQVLFKLVRIQALGKLVTAHCHCSSLVVLDSSGWDSGYRLSWHQKITPKIKPQRGQKNALTPKEWWPVSTLAQPTSRIWSGPPSARHPRKLHLIISSRRSDGDIHLCR